MSHRAVALGYAVIALTAVIVATSLSWIMRLHLAWPNASLPLWGTIKPEDYLALVTMHGTLMIFFVMTLAPVELFGNLLLPSQLGVRRMTLPVVNAAGMFLIAISLLVMLAAFLVPQGAPIGGWSAYPPMSALPSAGPGQGAGLDCWLLSLALFCAGSALNGINALVTIVSRRTRQMPITAWSWFATAILSVIIFPVLFAAIALLFCDRHLGTHFFLPQALIVAGRVAPLTSGGDGSPLLWQHLFWFFGHPEVYLSVLPAMGITSHIFAEFTRAGHGSRRLLVAATLAIAGMGLLVWGHHMFVSGMNPYAGTAFSLSTIAIALPSTAEVLVWLRMLWNGETRATWNRTPMLFSLGFLSFFIAGGVTGPVLAQPMLDSYLHNTYFVIAHFHLVMGMAVAFSMFAATYLWFPLLCGRMMNERLGRWHFWLSLIGAYGAFLPMHFAGLAGLPRHYAQMSGPVVSFENLLPLQRGITWSAYLLGAAQFIFLWNVARSWRRGDIAEPGPR